MLSVAGEPVPVLLDYTLMEDSLFVVFPLLRDRMAHGNLRWLEESVLDHFGGAVVETVTNREQVSYVLRPVPSQEDLEYFLIHPPNLFCLAGYDRLTPIVIGKSF